jgi:hypothetical protein
MRTPRVPTNRNVRLRKIEQIALAVGLTLIAISAVAQIHRFAISRATIAHFRAQNADATSDSVDPAVGYRGGLSTMVHESHRGLQAERDAYNPALSNLVILYLFYCIGAPVASA